MKKKKVCFVCSYTDSMSSGSGRASAVRKASSRSVTKKLSTLSEKKLSVLSTVGEKSHYSIQGSLHGASLLHARHGDAVHNVKKHVQALRKKRKPSRSLPRPSVVQETMRSRDR